MNEIGDFVLTNDNALITGESRKIRIWDLRQAAINPAQELVIKDFEKCDLLNSWVETKTVTGCSKVRYLEDCHIVASNFSGGNGVFTFDMRKVAPLEYYKYHYYPTSDFTHGVKAMGNVVVSTGPTQKLQYEL